MSAPYVPHQEVADLILRIVELQHDIIVLRRRLALVERPLAFVAASSLVPVETALGEALESLRDRAKLIASITQD